MHAIFYLNHKIIQSEHRLQLVNTFWILWVSCTSLFLLPVLKTSSKDETCSFCCQNKQLRAFSCFSYDPCDTHHSSDVMTLPLFFFYFFFSISCVSVFPESPRWQLATSQIPQLKWSVKEFTIRNQVCLLYGVAMTDSLLSGKLTRALSHTHVSLFYCALALHNFKVLPM